MENHLLIGLGGTGGRVLAAFRKLMFERFNGDVKPKDIWVDYIYVDSSKQDLEMKDPAQWSMMGKDISLGTDSVVQIPAANLRDYVDNRGRYKYLAPWLGESADWSNIINDPKIGEGAAGQKRRLGRLLFANGSQEFNRVVGVKARNLSYNPDGRKITYHVIAGLAGGTGSGSVVDVVAQLRQQFPDQANNRIILYLLLPEEHPNPTWASTGNYQPNGYVALTELSAMDLGLFKPWNLSERNYDVKRLDLTLPFYSAYLVTDTNREDVRFNVGKVIPSTIAELLYQKTVGVALSDQKIGEGATESASHFFNDVEKGENPNYADYDSPHSYKFNGFGIKRLAIPEQEIREFFGYNFAQQAVSKMLYNNLSRESGYVNEEPVNDDYAFVTKPEQKQKWYLTRDHLCLSKPILPEHQKEGWLTISDEYKKVDTFRKEVMANDVIKHADKLVAIRNKSKKFFEKDFRPIAEEGQNGVVTFYEKKTRFGREAIVSKIIDTINADLLNLWSSGEKSLYQVSNIVRTLLQFLEEEKQNLNRLSSSQDDEIKKRDSVMEAINKEWCHMGTITKLFADGGLNNRKDKLSSDFTVAVKEKYALMTWKVAYEFAKLLIDDLSKALQVTKGDVDNTSSQYQSALEILVGAVNTRCIEESEDKQSLKGVVIKNYDPKSVHRISKGAIANETDNNERVKLMSAALIGMLNPDKLNFREVYDKMKCGSVVSTLEKVGEELASTFFANEIGKDYIPNYEKLTGVNIVEKLHDEFSGNDDGLKKRLDQLVRHAAITNKHRDVEVNHGPKIRSSMFVILPDYDKDADFLQKIEDMIKSLTREGDIKVSRGGNSNEIVVVSLETNLTPRYLQNVYTLKEAYERLMSSQQGKVARFETQLEDYTGFLPANIDVCEKLGYLPSLYEPTDAEREEVDRLMSNSLSANADTIGINSVVSQQSGACAPPPPPLSEWFMYANNQQSGPFNIQQLQQMVSVGSLTKDTYVWKNGMSGWTPASQVLELASLFVTNTPPPPPPMMGMM